MTPDDRYEPTHEERLAHARYLQRAKNHTSFDSTTGKVR